jgi:hypothetical protein
MAKWYAAQQTGTADGTKTFTSRLDARQVGARHHRIIATKNQGEVWAASDTFYVGRLRAGESLRRASVVTDTAVAGISLGPASAPTKYANAVAAATLNVPTPIGPTALAAAAPPLTADEYLYATVTGGVGATVNFLMELEIAGLN